ncbi:MAG: PP2C family protein-serine/threonine phosphatase [Flavobacteriales bacterium]
MSARLTISRRIGLGFAMFILVVLVVFAITNRTISKSRVINRSINEEFAPSLSALQALDNHLMRSQDLARQWVFVQKRDDDRDKLEFMLLARNVIPAQLSAVEDFAGLWDPARKRQMEELRTQIYTLLANYSEIQQLLPDFDSYADPVQTMMAEELFIPGTNVPLVYEQIRTNLSGLIEYQESLMKSEIEAMNRSFSSLRLLMVNISLGTLIAGILIAILTSRSIVLPVESLRRKLTNLSQGIYSVHPVKAGNDEIGDMAKAVNILISNFEKTKEFSLQVGAGNFNVEFTPLSEYDELGKSLLRMRKDLASYRSEMEQKVNAQTIEIRRQKEAVEQQKERITELYHDLQSSIDYAQRLQESILPDEALIRKLFPESFVLFRPKATVSGDFYWFKELGNKKIFAAADCTGHGVPGAFMSLVGHNALNQVTKVFTRPDQILNNVNRLSSEALRHRGSDDSLRDGMDIAVCSIDPYTLQLEFSGAHNPVYIIRDGELTELESDPFSIGAFYEGERSFTCKTFQLQEGDCIYTFSDGYADQFGGPKNKKFMRKQFRETLLKYHHDPMPEQKWRLTEVLDRWKGSREQVDDILVIGVRV